MSPLSSKIPSLRRLFIPTNSRQILPFSSSTESHSQKLERIAGELLSLNKIERHDYSILFRLKLGLDRAAILPSAGASSEAGGADAAAVDAAEKTAFDVRLEKFEAASKIRVIKEVRAFTDLGLKEAKEIVEKAPVVIKKGVAKEDAEKIVAKLKEAGATAVFE